MFWERNSRWTQQFVHKQTRNLHLENRVNFDFMSICMWLFHSSMWHHPLVLYCLKYKLLQSDEFIDTLVGLCLTNRESRLECGDTRLSNFPVMFYWWLLMNLYLVQYFDALAPPLSPNWSANLPITFTSCWFVIFGDFIWILSVTRTNKTNEFRNIRRLEDFLMLICFLTHFGQKPQQNTRSAGARSPDT